MQGREVKNLRKKVQFVVLATRLYKTYILRFLSIFTSLCATIPLWINQPEENSGVCMASDTFDNQFKQKSQFDKTLEQGRNASW